MKRFHILTYGCTLNQYDSKLMRELLKNAGYIESNYEDADVVIINSCGVKDSTEKKIIYKIKNIKKPLIVGGCLATGDPSFIRKFSKNAVLIGTQSISKIVNAIDDALKGVPNSYFKVENKEKLGYQFNSLIEIIGIGEGCDSNCSYCFTKIARPRLYSLRIGEIIRRIKNAYKKGVKEIRLTAQDVGAYGLDHGSNLLNLVKTIAELDIDIKVRLGMMNPHHVYNQMEILDYIRERDIFYKFIHIPIQSGSNEVLKIMRRKSNIDQFNDIVKEVRRDPYFNIMTDIIVGHPGEKDNDFELTLELIRKTKPDTTNVSKYSIRPHTDSSKMPQIKREIINARSIEISNLVNSISEKRNSLWMNKTFKIIALEKVKTLVGRDKYYKQVAISNGTLGKSYKVRINEYGTSYLRGEIIEEPKVH